VTIRRPTAARVSWRRAVSTSGSSGIGLVYDETPRAGAETAGRRT
jgi:hypothetical protein